MMVHELLEGRASSHGDYLVTADIAQSLKAAAQVGNWDSLTSEQRESIHLICTKIARILSGNPYKVDHWRDIAGYAQLVVDRLED